MRAEVEDSQRGRSLQHTYGARQVNRGARNFPKNIEFKLRGVNLRARRPEFPLNSAKPSRARPTAVNLHREYN